MKKSKRLCKLIFLISGTFLLSSCGENLKAVEGFASAYKDQLKTLSSSVSQDIYQSCIRKINYIPLISSNSFDNRELAAGDCNSLNKKSANQVLAANSVLLTYMQSLQNVATGEDEQGSFISFEDNVNALGDAIQGISIPTKTGSFQVPEAFVSAGKSILKVILDVFTTQERSRAVKRAVLCSDDSIQLYITGNSSPQTEVNVETAPLPSGGLIGIVQDGYLKVLEIEKTQANAFYENIFAGLRPSNRESLGQFTQLTNGVQTIGMMQAYKDYNTALETVREKEEKARTYVGVLSATATAHHQLKNSFIGTGKNKIIEAELGAICQGVLNRADQKSNISIQAIEQAGKLDLTETQRKEFEVIMLNYFTAVRPLINKAN